MTPPGMGVDGWTVRLSSKGGSACPYCNRDIVAGKEHIVAWPEHDADAEQRKHWHMECWRRELRRGGP